MLIRFALICFGFMFLAGCQDSSPPISDPPEPIPADHPPAEVSPEVSTSEASSSEPATPAENPGITATFASWQEVQGWVASHQGKVVVVDVWSTVCLPCVKELPNFVEFHHAYIDKVACASLNVDFYGGKGTEPKENEPQILKILNSRKVDMTNFISTDPDEDILGEIDTVAIPAVLVYDASGKLAKVFNNDSNEYAPNGFNYENQVIPFVDGLLQVKTP